MNPFEQQVEFLSRDEELALANAWSKDRDVKARNKILLAHRPMIVALAKKFEKRYGLALDDLEQEGFIALQEVIDRYDPSRGLRFSTLARWWLVAGLQTYVMHHFTVVKYPTTRKVRAAFFKGARSKSVSLDAPMGDDGEGATMGERLVDPAARPDENAETTIDGERLNAVVAKALRKLKPRSRDILRKRVLQEEPATLDQLGEKYGLSKERIRQIQARALEDLERALSKMDVTSLS